MTLAQSTASSATTDGAADSLMDRARTGRSIARALPRRQRHQILDRAADLLHERETDAAAVIVAEAGKTIRQARKEARRAQTTLSLSAEEARRNAGEVVAFDAYPGSENRRGWFTREPLGIILAITPYNDPLNLVAHKVGPAVAGGNAVILKPSPHSMRTAQFLVDLLLEAGLPPEVVTIAHGDTALSAALVRQRDVRMVSFTGGFRTAEAITREAGIKKLTMELGGNAPVIVLDDADIDRAVADCVSGAFWAAGQNCVGAQRLLVQRPVYARFRAQFVAAAEALITGDPHDERTDVGPMITEHEAERAQRMVAQAMADGGQLLTGNIRRGRWYTPTVLEDVPLNCALWAEEAFAPIVILQEFDSDDDGLVLANEIDFALHAGVFTTSLIRAMRFADGIEAGGVMVNDSSDYRIDAMPFGGAKYGSMGREGVRFAYEEMTQPKVVALNL
ncbi:aldehyde dehydrogenase family protein [Microbacterium sp. NPDC077644]|uniref:aldehyde dehydrogenase family protein n=1 Tax=Microbacterium sp. NPDC077644 TaxID=3155055 RepID=UPI00344E51B3